MKKLTSLVLISLFVLFLSACGEGEDQPDPLPDPQVFCKGTGYTYDYESLDYQLVWSDEFDGDTLDLEKWTYEVNGSGGGNNELQYYTDQNTVVEDGLLKIIAKKESYNDRDYTSSRITSDFDFTYGIVEIRTKVPPGRGTWAANWMMPAYPTYGIWPNSGEIDIMEYVGYMPEVVHSTVHTKLFNHKLGSQKGDTLTIPNLEDAFQVYKVEWLPDKIIFSVDDVEVFTFWPGQYLDCPEFGQWPFDHDFFIILNIAIGGDWGGAEGVDDTIFPTTMEVDYVRVYQDETITNIEQEPVE
jgi:beta-glucanase (GH16 family)